MQRDGAMHVRSNYCAIMYILKAMTKPRGRHDNHKKFSKALEVPNSSSIPLFPWASLITRLQFFIKTAFGTPLFILMHISLIQ